MPSFSTLSLIATLACAVFTSAAPTPAPASVAVVGNGVAAAALNTRCDCDTIPSIIGDLTATVTPLTKELLSVTVETVGTVQPILAEIKIALTVAITNVKQLAGKSVEVVLATEGKVLSVVECANLVGALVVLLFTALGAVCKVLTIASHDVIFPLLAEIGCLVGELLQLILGLVGGLLVVLLPILAPVFAIIASLNITATFGFLGTKLI